jgi:transposase
MKKVGLHIIINHYILLLIVLLPQHLFSQKRSVPAKTKSIQVSSLIDSAMANLQSNPQISFDYIEEALTYSIKHNHQLTEAQSYRVLGMINQQLNQPDLAIS